MNLTRPTEVRALLQKIGVHPSKVMGQNFLIDRNILNILLDDAELTPDDRVLEVGPGLGVVTHALCERAGHVLAVEKDRRLAAYLRDVFADQPRLHLIEGDAMDVDLPRLLEEHQINKFVANLPYSVGTRVLIDCLHAARPPHRIVITVQNEVAERIAAPIDTTDYGLLSIWCQLDYEPRIRKRIAASCFYPPPQIQSAIVTLHRREREVTLDDEPLFHGLVKFAFSGRRKQIQALLRSFPPLRDHSEAVPGLLAAADIDPALRPEVIPVAAWCHLANAIHRHLPVTSIHPLVPPHTAPSPADR